MSDNSIRFESSSDRGKAFSVFAPVFSPVKFLFSLTFYISIVTFYLFTSKNTWLKKTWLLAKANFLTLTMFKQIEDLDGLMRSGSTGEPDELSKRLGVSKSTLFSFISSMKALGLPISYCRYRQSYYYSDNSVSLR